MILKNLSHLLKKVISQTNKTISKNDEEGQYYQMDSAGSELLKMEMTKLGLSVRAYGRILKVSRTIGDLDSSEGILSQHISEAIQYRCLDRKLWNH